MLESILSNIPAHICALIGFIFLIISTQVKKRKEILLFQSLFSLFFFLQYLLLGVYSASILCLLGLIRNIVFYFKNNKISNNIIITAYGSCDIGIKKAFFIIFFIVN